MPREFSPAPRRRPLLTYSEVGTDPKPVLEVARKPPLRSAHARGAGERPARSGEDYESRAVSRHPVHGDSHVDDQQWLEWERRAEPLGLGVTYRVNTVQEVDAADLARRIGQGLTRVAGRR
ncbi:hypothetical protein GCM10010404_80730 [Nonomuraea africana]